MLRDEVERLLGRSAPVAAEHAWSKIEVLGDLWRRYGRSLGLSGARDWSQTARHVAAGLLAVECGHGVGGERSWLDVGSGAGYCGLLAAACGWTVVLVEPRARRAGFLDLALGALGALGGEKSRVVRARLGGSTWNEVLANEQIEVHSRGYGITSARSVFTPETWLRHGVKWVRDDGLVLLHVRPESADPADVRPAVRKDGAGWSVRGFRPGALRGSLRSP